MSQWKILSRQVPSMISIIVKANNTSHDCYMQSTTQKQGESPYLHEEHNEQKSSGVSPAPHMVLASRRRPNTSFSCQIALRSLQQLSPRPNRAYPALSGQQSLRTCCG
ncbi:hypothetical protein Taro_034719 [Colocasia esculenta]|uniref:Uncharacterized protein n=1 Tax=Colocasia esculenta TaxID=4460 RepID=A0A843WCP7_COLES|nr:hypothetical protein [Colocasia esculenta]